MSKEIVDKVESLTEFSISWMAIKDKSIGIVHDFGSLDGGGRLTLRSINDGIFRAESLRCGKRILDARSGGLVSVLKVTVKLSSAEFPTTEIQWLGR